MTRLRFDAVAVLLSVGLPLVAGAQPVAVAQPRVILKLVPTLALPASVGVEYFVSDRVSAELDVGAGLGGGGGTVSLRRRFCAGCDGGAGFAFGVGPELLLVPITGGPRIEGALSLVAEPAFLFRGSGTAAFVLGLKAGLGIGSGLGGDGRLMALSPVLVVGFVLGLQL